MIECRSVSKTYSRGVFALKDVTLSVDKGDFVFLTGPSGAGKSTLLRLLLRQEIPSGGILRVGGRDLADMSKREVQAYRRSLGFIFQNFNLIPTRTVVENVAIVPRVLGQSDDQQKRRAFQVLKWVGLQHRIGAFPQELSGGEQQRVAIARALFRDPPLLLVDEPTANLDRHSASAVIDLLSGLRDAGRGLLVASHDERLIAAADRVIAMESIQ